MSKREMVSTVIETAVFVIALGLICWGAWQGAIQ